MWHPVPIETNSRAIKSADRAPLSQCQCHHFDAGCARWRRSCVRGCFARITATDGLRYHSLAEPTFGPTTMGKCRVAPLDARTGATVKGIPVFQEDVTEISESVQASQSFLPFIMLKFSANMDVHPAPLIGCTTTARSQTIQPCLVQSRSVQ